MMQKHYERLMTAETILQIEREAPRFSADSIDRILPKVGTRPNAACMAAPALRTATEKVGAMNLLDLIETQMISNRLPLSAVSLAAVPHVDTPIVMNLHWHGFVEVPLVGGCNPVVFQPVPSSALQINERWRRFDEIENELLETAWELGAWDVERMEAKPFRRPGADAHEGMACAQAFGVAAGDVDNDAPVVSDAPDAADLIDAAGQQGYIHWLFRPVRGGLWSSADDVTLESGGYRNPACPLLARPVTPPTQLKRSRKTVFPLGKSARLI
jgi:hypothetical protein